MQSQGILVFEISDSKNNAVTNLPITIYQGGVPFKSYTTGNDGRVVDNEFPQGKYSYSFEYGDLNKDTFSVSEGKYTWVNLDYRVLQISFMNDLGEMQSDKRATVYKINPDYSTTYICEKYSDQTGVLQFTLPKGDYLFSTFKGDSTIHLEDENVNTEVEMSSGQITHSFNFRFVRNGREIVILTKEFEVTYIGKDSVYHYGSADVAPSVTAWSVNGYYEASRSSTPISLCAGTFAVSVETREYGVLTDTIVVTDNDRLTGNIHDFVLKDPSEIDPHDNNDDDDDDDNNNDDNGDEDDDDEPETFNVIVKVLSNKDSITPVAKIPVIIENLQNGAKVGMLTGSGGVVTFEAKGPYNIYVLNDTMKNFEVTQDTIIHTYTDLKATRILFDFFYGDEQFSPSSIKDIVIWDSYNSDVYFKYPSTFTEATETYEIEDSILLPPGLYTYSFYLAERGYDQRINKSLSVHKSDTVTHAVTKLTPFHLVTIKLLNVYGEAFESRQYIHQIVGKAAMELLTDSAGIYTESYLEGSYTFAALGDTQTIKLKSDTTLYFKSKGYEKKVYFQFIHDGKLVYPQIMNMDIYKADSTKYCRIKSELKDNYNGNEKAWVFSSPAICDTGKYFVKYELKDYDFKGVHSRLFEIPGNTSRNDTTIYIVVPVKRTVTIYVKDANLNLLQGVNANIYKYDENGVLSTSTYYDDNSHEGIRTNIEGQVIDLLTPGRYQLRIIDIVRDFIVKDYDMNFDVVSGAKMYDVKYIALYKENNEPATNLLLDIQKNGTFYNSTYTDENGTVEIFCEKGSYSYFLHYGEEHKGNYELKADTTIYLYLENPISIDSMYINGCVCVSHGDTIDLSLRILPENATSKEVEWEVDNQALAKVTSDNKLVINNISLEGFFTLTAKAVDEGKKSVSKRYHVGADCGSSFTLRFVGTEDRDLPISADTISLRIRPDNEDGFDHVFLYQISTDSINWSNLSEPTMDTIITVSTSNISKYAYLRALTSTSREAALDFAETGNSSCGADKISNSLILRHNQLTPANWADSICSNHGDLYFAINRQALDKLPEGYQIEWATKQLGDAEYTPIAGMSGKDTLKIAFDSTAFVRVAIQKDSNIMVSYEHKIFVEQLPSITLTSDKDTVCLNDTLRLSVTVNNGQIGSYTWSTGEIGQSTVDVIVRDSTYSVIAQSFHKLCPAQYDTIRLVVDKPIDIQVYADQAAICETQTEGTILRVDKMGNLIGGFTWSNQSKADTLLVTPDQTTSYSVEASSLYDRCPRIEKSTSVEVRKALSVQLSVDEDDICQTGTDSVTLSAKALSGSHYHYIWWDSTETDVPERTVLIDQSSSPWVMIRDSVCADSEKDSVKIRVAHPSEATIKTTTKVVKYGSSINLVAETTTPVIGPYTWYGIAEDGTEEAISTTEEAHYIDFPKEDVTYYYLAENGACPIIVSDKIAAHMTDNIVIPTLFTPHTADGFNDDFMPGYKVIIYDRYGNIVCNSSNGWDGTYRGDTADPGVYMYVITLKDGRVEKGTIEVFRK
ncbi:MAG: gliding motility-associated C-terminal domain-containing protein [Paludibacteraceae bacterium]|nr:gliding motility-associated C-terminal domain-containing protein [Paludibacteraceae bacterium]